MPVARSEDELPRKWADWCDTWAKRLGLAGRWDLRYRVRDRLSRGAAASVNWSKGYQNAVVRFRRAYIESPEWGDSTQEHTVIHEHVHLLLARLDDIASAKMGLQSKGYREYAARAEEVTDELAALFKRAYSRKTRIV